MGRDRLRVPGDGRTTSTYTVGGDTIPTLPTQDSLRRFEDLGKGREVPLHFRGRTRGRVSNPETEGIRVRSVPTVVH